jgi:hypothetical protein
MRPSCFEGSGGKAVRWYGGTAVALASHPERMRGIGRVYFGTKISN